MLCALLSRGVAQASTPARCIDARVHVEGVIPGAWGAALERACEDLAAQSDRDPGVVIRVFGKGNGVTVEAASADGRVAQRDLASPDELAITFEALGRIPKPAQALSEARPAVPASTGRRKDSAGSDSAPESNLTVGPVGVGVGVTAMGRVNLPGYAAVGGEMWAEIQLSNWLFGLDARWDAFVVPFDKTLPGFEMDSLGAGFLVGRRASLSPFVTLDGGVTANLIVDTQSVQATDGEHSGQQADVRFGALARAHLGRAPLRWALSTELEVSPSRLRRHAQIDEELPVLPSVGLGLGLGAAWGGP